MSTLSVPKWMDHHGETKIYVFVDMDDTSYEAECQRHYTKSGLVFGSAEKAERWECPNCVKEAKEYEVATRDD